MFIDKKKYHISQYTFQFARLERFQLTLLQGKNRLAKGKPHSGVSIYSESYLNQLRNLFHFPILDWEGLCQT